MPRRDDKSAADARLKRWALQGAARKLVPDERVATCYRRMIPGQKSVDVHGGEGHKGKGAYYKGLQRCASVWLCPVCSNRITERRRVELTEAIRRNKHLHAVMVSLTMHHTRRDNLKDDLLPTLLSAYRRMTSGRWYKNWCKVFGVVGTVRAVEVTYWINGWHPHLHVIAFLDAKLSKEGLEEFTSRVRDRWLAILAKSGHTADAEHGVVVTDRDGDIARYVAKFGHEPDPNRWGIEHELTKSPSKLGHTQHRTPTQLLGDYLAGDKGAGRLWVTYAKAFKGKHQLQWSRGLRALLGIGAEQTDDAIAKSEVEELPLLAQLSVEQWRVVLGYKQRGQLLEVARTGDAVLVSNFVATLVARRQYERGDDGAAQPGRNVANQAALKRLSAEAERSRHLAQFIKSL